MTASEEIQKLIAELQAALVQASGRINELGMRVSELGVELATVFEKGASGELDLKLIKIGGGGTVTDASTLSLKMEPTDTVSAAHLDDELTGALTVIEAAIAAIDNEFELTEANVEIAFETSIEGKVSLVVGGKATRERTHVARVTFEPDE